MPEFKVTVTSGYKMIYYVQAKDWEEAEDVVTRGDCSPDFEEYTRDQVDTEEVEDESP